LSDLARIDQKKPSNVKILQKSIEMKNIIRLTNEMVEDVDCRRKVAQEVFDLLSKSAQIIQDDPAFFEVYTPVKVMLKTFKNECKNVEHKKLFKEFEKIVQAQDMEF